MILSTHSHFPLISLFTHHSPLQHLRQPHGDLLFNLHQALHTAPPAHRPQTPSPQTAHPWSWYLYMYTPRTLDSHDINAAMLSICGGIAGAISKCQGSPASTSGARLDLTPAVAGATINVSKGRWEGCVRAARAVRGDSVRGGR